MKDSSQNHVVAGCCIGSSVPSTEFLLLRIALLGNGRDAFSGVERTELQVRLSASSRCLLLCRRPRSSETGQKCSAYIASSFMQWLSHTCTLQCVAFGVPCRAVCCTLSCAFDRVPLAEELHCLAIAVVRRASMGLPTGWHHCIVSAPCHAVRALRRSVLHWVICLQRGTSC